METEKSWEKTHREKSCQLESGLVQWGNEQIFSLENNYETEGKYFLKDLGFWKLTKSNWEIEKHLFFFPYFYFYFFFEDFFFFFFNF